MGRERRPFGSRWWSRWAPGRLFPLVLLLVHASQTHTTFTGADGLIGADGVLGADQLQYLAWARDAGSPCPGLGSVQLLAQRPRLPRAAVHDQRAALEARPVSAPGLPALEAGGGAHPRPGDDGLGATGVPRPGRPPRPPRPSWPCFSTRRSPPCVDWTQIGGKPLRFQLYLLGDELLAGQQALGLCAERDRARARAGGPARRRARTRSRPRRRGPATERSAGAWTAAPSPSLTLAALLAAWLHPWQGITLILIFVGLAVWQRDHGGLGLIVPAVGAALPLAYYYLLGHTDPAWQLAAQLRDRSRGSGSRPFSLGFGPLVLLGAFGLRDPGAERVRAGAHPVDRGRVRDLLRQRRVCAPRAPGPELPAGRPHRARLAAAADSRPCSAPLAVLICTVPGLAYQGRKFVRAARSHAVQYYLPAGDEAALQWIADRAPAGRGALPRPVRGDDSFSDRAQRMGGPWLLEPGLLCPQGAGRRAVPRP